MTRCNCCFITALGEPWGVAKVKKIDSTFKNLSRKNKM